MQFLFPVLSVCDIIKKDILKKGLDTMTIFIYKWIAVITMLFDHMGDSFFGNNMVMRCIGRFAFPCYAFMLAEGFRHLRTSDKRISSHAAKLVVLAFVSEFCYDLLECGFNINNYMASQNNIITLLLAFVGLIATEKWKGQPFTIACVYLLTAFLNYACGSNYRFVGVLLVYAFYWYLNLVMQGDPAQIAAGNHFRLNDQQRPVYDYGKRLMILLAITIVYIPLYHWARFNFTVGVEYITQFVHYLPWYITHIAIAALLAMYNGQVGYKAKWFGMFYSWFYPAHLLLLGIIKIAFFS